MSSREELIEVFEDTQAWINEDKDLTDFSCEDGERIVIRRFKEPGGQYLTRIIGQDRLAFAMTDISDLYDLMEWAKRAGWNLVDSIKE